MNHNHKEAPGLSETLTLSSRDRCATSGELAAAS
jgi:hypothetical protein